MDEGKHSHHHHGGPDGEHVHLDPGPYWRRAHHDWRFWMGVFLMFAAMTIYFMTVDLSLVPHIHTQPRPSANSGVPSKFIDKDRPVWSHRSGGDEAVACPPSFKDASDRTSELGGGKKNGKDIEYASYGRPDQDARIEVRIRD